ncbi:MAG: CehA/McbA family metallohydrolase [Actinomycetota bacterium]
MTWLKGNLHTHTDASDGDSPLAEVARWYDDHGYQFLAITDHNVRVNVSELQAVLRGEGRDLVLVPGEELSSWWAAGDSTYALHVNGLNTSHRLGPSNGESVAEVLQSMVDRVLDDGAIPSLNHPNFWASVSWEDMERLEGLSHFEVFNGHPLSYSFGTESLPTMDLVWDRLLNAGRRLYGIAVDDAHDFRSWGPEFSNPGRGWVMVEADELSQDQILTALSLGRFYASTGPELARVDIQSSGIEIETAAPGWIEFIANGEVCERSFGVAASCMPPADGYLRARVSVGQGIAWSQPLFRG